MKIDLAVYTAQEGYAWQPDTAIARSELFAFKECIGKFPSTTDYELPYGGVFLKGDQVVFYRFHIASRIDFRGRDALYCVLGVVPRNAAGGVDPRALFALPEFAGPMIPFPATAEVPAAAADDVPEWLRSLDRTEALDVRITGGADAPKYAVKQQLAQPITQPQPQPQPPPPPPPQPQPPPPTQPGAGDGSAADGDDGRAPARGWRHVVARLVGWIRKNLLMSLLIALNAALALVLIWLLVAYFTKGGGR